MLVLAQLFLFLYRVSLDARSDGCVRFLHSLAEPSRFFNTRGAGAKQPGLSSAGCGERPGRPDAEPEKFREGRATDWQRGSIKALFSRPMVADHGKTLARSTALLAEWSGHSMDVLRGRALYPTNLPIFCPPGRERKVGSCHHLTPFSPCSEESRSCHSRGIRRMLVGSTQEHCGLHRCRASREPPFKGEARLPCCACGRAGRGKARFP